MSLAAILQGFRPFIDLKLCSLFSDVSGEYSLTTGIIGIIIPDRRYETNRRTLGSPALFLSQVCDRNACCSCHSLELLGGDAQAIITCGIKSFLVAERKTNPILSNQ